MKAFLVANPNAGRMRGNRYSKVEAGLRERGLDVVGITATGPEGVAGALREALAGESPDTARVLAAGGDGTIHTVLPALCGTDFPLAILPVGSVNVLARELGVPLNIEKACDVAAAGRVRRIDLGLANGRPFALMAGVGFDAEVVAAVAPAVKGLIGSFAYVAKGLDVLARYPSSLFRLRTESEEFESRAWLAVISNAAHYTYRWRLNLDARIDDGWLDVCLFEADSPAQTAQQVVAALSGRHRGHPGVRHLRAQLVRVECEPSVAYQLDGDPMGITPVEIRLQPTSLSVLVPNPR
jgi:YegS/Rv2252/BmrU family lipid kinase